MSFSLRIAKVEGRIGAYLPGATYQVRVATAPYGQRCSVTGGSGTVSNASVTSIGVSCQADTTGYQVGGIAYGLSGTLALNVAVQPAGTASVVKQ